MSEKALVRTERRACRCVCVCACVCVCVCVFLVVLNDSCDLTGDQRQQAIDIDIVTNTARYVQLFDSSEAQRKTAQRMTLKTNPQLGLTPYGFNAVHTTKNLAVCTAADELESTFTKEGVAGLKAANMYLFDIRLSVEPVQLLQTNLVFIRFTHTHTHTINQCNLTHNTNTPHLVRSTPWPR